MQSNSLCDISTLFLMPAAAAAADPAVAFVAAGLRWLTSGDCHLLPAAELTAEPKSKNIVRHIYMLQLPNSVPVEIVLSGFCVNGQHWFHCRSQVTHHALNPLRFRRSQCCCIQLCLCTALCNYLLLFLCMLSGCVFPASSLLPRRLSGLLATGPVRVREHCQLFSQLPMFKHLSPLSPNECYVCSILIEEQTSGNL